MRRMGTRERATTKRTTWVPCSGTGRTNWPRYSTGRGWGSFGMDLSTMVESARVGLSICLSETLKSLGQSRRLSLRRGRETKFRPRRLTMLAFLPLMIQ